MPTAARLEAIGVDPTVNVAYAALDAVYVVRRAARFWQRSRYPGRPSLRLLTLVPSVCTWPVVKIFR
jgi:hypothetical protein